MGTYYINEAAFDLPQLDFIDETIHCLRAKVGEAGDLHVLAFRSRVPEQMSPRDVVLAHRENERRTLAAFTVLSEKESVVGGERAIEAALRFRNEGGPVYQRNVHFVANGEHLLIAVNGPLAEREACDETMDRLLGSLRFRHVR